MYVKILVARFNYNSLDRGGELAKQKLDASSLFFYFFTCNLWNLFGGGARPRKFVNQSAVCYTLRGVFEKFVSLVILTIKLRRRNNYEQVQQYANSN